MADELPVKKGGGIDTTVADADAAIAPVGVDVGATWEVLWKSPPFATAEETSAARRESASAGTVDMNPIRGGSTEGCVKLP